MSIVICISLIICALSAIFTFGLIQTSQEEAALFPFTFLMLSGLFLLGAVSQQAFQGDVITFHSPKSAISTHHKETFHWCVPNKPCEVTKP
jgi:hypothetical protein